MIKFLFCTSFFRWISSAVVFLFKQITTNKDTQKTVCNQRLNTAWTFQVILGAKEVFLLQKCIAENNIICTCGRLQRIEQQTVSQQSSCSQKPQAKQSSHFDRMWQLAGYRRCQKDVSQQNLMSLLLLPKTYTEQIDVSFLRLSCWKNMYDGVPPSSVQFIKVICFIRSAFSEFFASAAWEIFFQSKLKMKCIFLQSFNFFRFSLSNCIKKKIMTA